MSEKLEIEIKKRAIALQRAVEKVTGESYEDLTGAVQSVIDEAKNVELFQHLIKYSFQGNKTIERIDVYFSYPTTELSQTFYQCSNLKYIKGMNTSKCIRMNQVFSSCPVEVIEEPFDLSSLKKDAYHHSFRNATNLIEFRAVPNTIFIDIEFGSRKLSNESKQSIFDGLAIVTTTQTLTLPPTLKILQSQVDSANAKGWTVAGGTVVSEEEYYG